MFRKTALFLLVFVVAAYGLSTVTKRKTYTEGQTFTASDYNADIDESVTWVNAVNAKFPGTSPNDSTKTTIGVHDTLLSTTGVITIKSYLKGVDKSDSLVFDAAHLDTLWIGSATGAIVGFVGGTTAGPRVNFGSLVRADSVWIGTTRPTVGFTSGATPGNRVRYPYVDADTLRGVDTLNATAARLTRLHLSAAPVGVSFADFATAGVRLRRAHANIDSIVGVDRLLVGTTTPVVGFSSVFTAGNRVDFGSLVAIDSLRIRDSLTVAGTATFLGVATFSDSSYHASIRAEDIHLASGAVIYINGVDITITAAANTLTWAGATSGYIFNDGQIKVTVATDGDYAAEFYNTDADNGNGVIIGAADDNNVFALRILNYLVSTELFNVKGGGQVFIGNETANANMTVGLTINQGANDDQAFALKSSDVAHGVTTISETDTYVGFKKTTGAGGGLTVFALSDADLTPANTLYFDVTSGVAADATKTTAGRAVVEFFVALASGTGQTNIGADGNLLAIKNGGSARFIFDGEGSAHADVEWTTYDTHDDLSRIYDMEQELLNREPESQTDRRHLLEEMGVIGKDSWHMEQGRPRAMVNFTKLAMLHHGALIQVGDRLDQLDGHGTDILDLRKITEQTHRQLYSVDEVLDSLRTENRTLRQRVASLESSGLPVQPYIFRSN